MEEIIKEKCQEIGIDPEILTAAEIEVLKEEIEAEKRGEVISDSVLDNPELFFRDLR